MEGNHSTGGPANISEEQNTTAGLTRSYLNQPPHSWPILAVPASKDSLMIV